MKCSKCGNEFPSNYYFAIKDICHDCYNQLPKEEQENLLKNDQDFILVNYDYRVGFGMRLGAYLIDMMIMISVIIAIFTYTGFFEAMGIFTESIMEYQNDPAMLEQMQKQFISEQMPTLVFSNILSLIYFGLEILIGATLGKLILGLRIGDTDGYSANSSKLIIRYSLKNISTFFALIGLFFSPANWISFIALLVLIIGFFFTLGEKRQAFHDIIAKSAVYRKKDIREVEENYSNI